MELVRKNTNIPVPQPRYPQLEGWLIMDRIHGRSLEGCWNSLSIFMQFRIACTMRCYVKQLRRVSGSIPGTPEGYIGGNLFDCNEWGPLKDARHFRRLCESCASSQWLNRMVRYTQHPTGVRPSSPVSPHDWSLSFAHGDLHVGNLMLSNDNVLWVVDWGSSGFYPPWIETAYVESIADTQPKSWNRWRWFMVGRNPDHVRCFWEDMFTTLARLAS